MAALKFALIAEWRDLGADFLRRRFGDEPERFVTADVSLVGLSRHHQLHAIWPSGVQRFAWCALRRRATMDVGGAEVAAELVACLTVRIFQ